MTAQEAATAAPAVSGADITSEALAAAYAQGWAAACAYLATVADAWAAENAQMAADTIDLDDFMLCRNRSDEALLKSEQFAHDCTVHTAMAVCAANLVRECQAAVENCR